MGIIAAATDNARNIAGIAGGRGPATPRVRVLPIVINSESNQKDKWTISIALAVEYAMNQGADVISMSLQIASAPSQFPGGQEGSILIPNRSPSVSANDLLQRALDAGVVLVAASGNAPGAAPDDEPLKDSTQTQTPDLVPSCDDTRWPAVLSGVISVGAVKFNGEAWEGTCGAPDLVAPGGETTVPSLRHHLTTGQTPRPADDFILYGGTSASTPHVAGVAALLLSVKPSLTWQQVRWALTATADPSGCISASSVRCGEGLLDAYAALHYVLEQHGGPEQDVTLTEDLTVPPGDTWDLGAITLRFTNGARLLVQGTLNATGTTFDTGDAEGWGGIRYASGTSGTLDGVTIRNAGNTSEGAFAGVWVQDATVTILGGLIEDGRERASGVRVVGSQSHVTISDETTIQNMPKNGVLATGHGTATVHDARILDNGSSGIAATTNALVYVGSPTAGTRGVMSNRIRVNDSQGILAASNADVVHVGAPVYGRRGYNYVFDNGPGGGIVAQTGAFHNAGSASQYARDNWFEDNGRFSGRYVDGKGPDAIGYHLGTTVQARYDWWGRPTDPDTLAFYGTTKQAHLAVDPMLTGPPAAVSFGDSFGGAPPDPADVGGDSFTDALSLAQRGDGPGAVRLLAGEVARRPGAPDAATALTLAGSLAAGTDRRAQAAALALLRRESRSARADHRAWARRGLIRAYGRAGDTARMTAEAEAMLGDDPDAVSALVASLVLAYGRAETGDAAGAWAAWDAASALITSGAVEDTESVEAASDDLIALVGERTTEARVAAAPAGVAVAEESTGPVGLGAPYPNPAGSGAVTVPFGLGERARVRLAVVDVLGREVAVLADGTWEAGDYAVRLDAGRLAPGAYAVRLTVSGAVVSARVLTVTR